MQTLHSILAKFNSDMPLHQIKRSLGLDFCFICPVFYRSSYYIFLDYPGDRKLMPQILSNIRDKLNLSEVTIINSLTTQKTIKLKKTTSFILESTTEEFSQIFCKFFEGGFNVSTIIPSFLYEITAYKRDVEHLFLFKKELRSDFKVHRSKKNIFALSIQGVSNFIRTNDQFTDFFNEYIQIDIKSDVKDVRYCSEDNMLYVCLKSQESVDIITNELHGGTLDEDKIIVTELIDHNEPNNLIYIVDDDPDFVNSLQVKQPTMNVSQLKKTLYHTDDNLVHESKKKITFKENDSPIESYGKTFLEINDEMDVEFFNGELTHIRLIHINDAHLKDILSSYIDGKKIALDLEWVADLNPNEFHPIALYQICSSKGACLIRSPKNFNEIIPQNFEILKNFLENNQFIMKGCFCDDKKLAGMFGDNLKCDYEDVEATRLRAYGDGGNFMEMIRKFAGKPSAEFKNKKISISNWQNSKLTTIQVIYAAFDVVGLYKCIPNFPPSKEYKM